MRWDIEKVFDEFKNKLREKKSWASSPIAKCIHAQCLLPRTQHSVKLIRWLRSCLFLSTSCEAILGRLRRLYRTS